MCEAPDLILADGEVTGFKSAPKINAVTEVDLAGNGSAKDVAIVVDDFQVGIGRTLREKIDEERVASGTVKIVHGGELRQGHEKLLRIIDQSLVIRRNEAGQPHGVLMHERLSKLALFEVSVEREPQRRDDREKNEQQQPGPQTCKRKPRHSHVPSGPARFRLSQVCTRERMCVGLNGLVT